MNVRAAPQRAHDGNISCLTRENCSQLFFVYAGGLGMVEGMGPMVFLQKSGISDRNVAFVRDPEVRYFHNGVGGDMSDLDSVLDWHFEHLAASPHVTDVYCVGNSFGGWAALFFGYMLAAKKVWALAPAGVWGLGLLQDLMAESNGVTEYDLYYSQQEKKDVRFAKGLENTPGVRLFHKEEYGHMMIHGLLRAGELPKLFPAFKAAA